MKFFGLFAVMAGLACAEPPSPVKLTLKRALDIALSTEGNTRLQIAREFVVQAQSRSDQARSALLPKVELTTSAQSFSRNLGALGLRSASFGFPVPEKVGPFGIFDARGSVGQKLLDLSALYQYRSTKHEVSAAAAESGGAAEQIASDVAAAYFAAVRASSRLAALQADVELAEAVLKTSVAARAAGTSSGLDVDTAQLQVSESKQSLLAAQMEVRRSQVRLIRVLGLRTDSALELTDRLPQPSNPVESFSEALQTALERREDWKAQLHREEQMRSATSAARAERLPSVYAFADYGAIGASPASAFGTHTIGISVSVPVLDGGQRKASAAAAASRLRQERARTEELRQTIQAEIQVASDALKSTAEQIRVAEESMDLARRTCERAQRVYAAGAGTQLAATEARRAMARAHDSWLEALYAYNLAWVEWHRSTGGLQLAVALEY